MITTCTGICLYMCYDVYVRGVTKPVGIEQAKQRLVIYGLVLWSGCVHIIVYLYMV